MTATVIYECGCSAEEVGQEFDDGILVCPIHRQRTAPFEHIGPFDGRVRIELLVRAESRERAQRWCDDLVETLLRDEIVRGVDTGGIA